MLVNCVVPYERLEAESKRLISGRANWRTLFGKAQEVAKNAPVPCDELIGNAWLYARHARTCIERKQPWQAEWSISGVRDSVLALASLRHGYATGCAKGADLLPTELTASLESTLVGGLDDVELRRALRAAAAALDRTDAALAARLRPLLVELS